MRELAEILRRNRRVIGLFVLMVLLPASISIVLIIRALRSEDVRAEYQQRQRQRQIVRLAEADLNNWLFSTRAESAMSKSLLRFQIDGNQILFSDYQFSLPSTDPRSRLPFASMPEGNQTMVQSITEIYYPRIQAFLRDFSAGQNSGAQYFRRLKAIIVRLQGQNRGYVLEAQKAVDYVNQRLGDFCAGENFGAALSVADVTENSPPSPDAFALEGFPFFWVVFMSNKAAGFADFREHAFAYSMLLLTLVTILGSIFVHRAVAHEVALSRLRTDFMSAVSHEFRSPLSSILALSERLESNRVLDQQKLGQYHRMIGQEARRLNALVAKFLDFARIEEGKKAYSLERVNLFTVAREAIQSCGNSIQHARIQLSTEEDDSPLWVLADQTAMQHCIQNLIENAVKYSPRDSVVTVECGRAGTSNFVEVSDLGIGISLSEQRKVFEKFYRGKNASQLYVQGAGIGLALVKHVMESHGGSVSVESQPGQGSRFRLLLPRVEA